MDTQYGKVIAPILRESDYIAGQESALIFNAINPQRLWKKYLPTGESQVIGGNFETGGCTNFTELNLLETYGMLAIELGLIKPENVQWLRDQGYFDENGRLDFSDRALYVLSGTTINGNRVEYGWDAIRKYGLIAEKTWGSKNISTYAEWTKPVSQAALAQGLEFKKRFEVFNEWVIMGNCGAPNLDILEKHLQQAPLQIIHPVCTRDEKRVFQNCMSCACQHSTLLTEVDRANKLLRDFDSYKPYINEYVIDYPMIWVLKAIFQDRAVVQPPQTIVFHYTYRIDLRYGQRSKEVLMLQKGLNSLGAKIPVDIYPDGTGYYGNLTMVAVREFQARYQVASADVLLQNGGKIFGPLTRNKINQLLQ